MAPQITEVLFLPVCTLGCSLTFIESYTVPEGLGWPRTEWAGGCGRFPIVDVDAGKRPQPAV